MRTIAVIYLLVLFASAAAGADYYVSKRGSDANPGSLEEPWRTIQKAANTLLPGDTAWIRTGRYRERVKVNVSGSAPDQFVTLRAYPGEKPAIDGAGLAAPTDSDSALLLIENRSYVRVEGLAIRNYRALRGDVAISGVMIQGECDHIEIRNNDIHHIRYRSKRGNAFGLAVYGTSADKPVSDVVIDGNQIHHCKLGNSESLSVNGNVVNCQVTRNRVHDNDNIGIVFIGYEGTCPDPAQDRARDSICRENEVWNIKSYGNPAYGRVFSAGGIYVDGGTRILIERNTAHHCDIGVELASEHAGETTSEVELRENLIFRNRIGGLFMGGYDELRGGTTNCRIHHNTFFENDTRRNGNGELYLQHYVSGNTIHDNVFVAGRQSLLLGNPASTNTGNVLDYNLYFARNGAEECTWEWRTSSLTGFESYRSATGNDAHSSFADPLFIDSDIYDFHVHLSSPAVDAGDPQFAPGIGETDFDGAERVSGTRVDLGAFEFLAQAPN